MATLLALIAVSVLLATTILWFLRANQVAIPDNRIVFLAGWAGSGLLGAASMVGTGASWVSYAAGGFALVGGAFMLGLYALRKQQASNPISVGDTVPSFSATTDEDGSYSSEDLLGTPTLLKFFRGHW